MPLASWYALHWYGPGLGAAVEVASEPTASATLKGRGKLAAVNTTAPTASARINLGRPLTAYHTTAPTAYARVSARGRMAAVGKVNAISQDDVTGAVLEAQVEGTLTVKQALRYLLAVAQGNATGLGGPDVAYKSLDGATTRIAGTVADGTRTITTRNPA